MVHRTCETCAKEFLAKASEVAKGYAKYCSRACQHEALKRGEHRTCPQCGNTFWAMRCQTQQGTGIYCSNVCYALGKRKIAVYRCQECGNEFTPKFNKSKNHPPLYCSWQCQYKHRRKDLPGDELRRMYVDEGQTIYQIGKHFGVAGATVQARLADLGIPRRNHAERLVGQARFGNSLETAVQAMLDGLGIVYQTSKRIEHRAYDFYLPDLNTLIECDGTFWHADPRFFPDRTALYPLQQKQVIHDRLKNEIAQRHGYRLLRLWEHDVFNDRDAVLAQLTALQEPTEAA